MLIFSKRSLENQTRTSKSAPPVKLNTFVEREPFGVLKTLCSSDKVHYEKVCSLPLSKPNASHCRENCGVRSVF